jgi:hypothetical protein
VKHETTLGNKKQIKGKLTLESCVSLGCFPPGLLAFVHGLGVFLLRTGEKMRSDG